MMFLMIMMKVQQNYIIATKLDISHLNYTIEKKIFLNLKTIQKMKKLLKFQV